MSAVPLPFVAMVALLGLAVGSFLNVVIYRVPRGESVVRPGSHCPRCDSAIKRRHNIPVLGWLILRGRCYSCSLPISARYPSVEAATAVGMAVAARVTGLTASLPVAIVGVPVLITLGMMTFDRRIASSPDAATTAPTLPAPHRRSSPWPR